MVEGSEPKIFPGVVSRRRGSSMRDGSVQDGEHGEAHSGFRRDGSAVVEEADSEDDEA